MSNLAQFARSFPVSSTSDYWGDRVVTQGHADYCAANGHAFWVVDGVDKGVCPRCGVVTTPAAPVDAVVSIPVDAEEVALETTDQRAMREADEDAPVKMWNDYTPAGGYKSPLMGRSHGTPSHFDGTGWTPVTFQA